MWGTVRALYSFHNYFLFSYQAGQESDQGLISSLWFYSLAMRAGFDKKFEKVSAEDDFKTSVDFEKGFRATTY
jgi:hypothetical protein